MNNSTEKKNYRGLLIAICAAIITAVIFFAVTLVIIPNSNYKAAVKLMESGKYEEAIAAFEALDDYKDSADKIEECNAAILENDYNNATALMDEGKYEEAISAFEALNSYKDSADRITECSYGIAVDLKNAGKYEEAIAAFEALNGYNDSTALIEKCEQLILLANARVGDYIYFGSYEQDNSAFNGKEDIEWLVLDRYDNMLFIISKYALDAKPYNENGGNLTWEKCTLRSWLNNDFYNTAFSEEDKLLIVQANITDDKNGTISDAGTTDNVFLLSIPEAEKYFSADNERQCIPTDYAIAQGAYTNSQYIVDGKPACWWWLRSPSSHWIRAALIDYHGLIDSNRVFYGTEALNGGNDCVRPALWINVDA